MQLDGYLKFEKYKVMLNLKFISKLNFNIECIVYLDHPKKSW